MQTSLQEIKVAVGLSGGVDSSLSAWLLKEAGFEVIGVYLRCYWTYEGCVSDQDRASAARMASFLNIPFEVWDFEKEYREKVVEYFYGEYEKGRTPNPDVVCNREIKFGLFFEEAIKKRGFNFIATGHYAGVGIEEKRVKSGETKRVIWPFGYQVEIDSDRELIKIIIRPEYFNLLKHKWAEEESFSKLYRGASIFRGVDEKKDQSYFLYDISQKAIDHSLYPLFNFKKEEVRRLAKVLNLPTANRPDSQGICFLGEVNVEKFLKERITEHAGEVLDTKGRIIGTHKGVEFYTIGQRHGFQIKSQSSNPPYYVVGKEVMKNRLVVGEGEECKVGHFRLELSRSNAPCRLKRVVGREQLLVRIRHLGEMIPCRVRVAGGNYRVLLDYSVFGVAPGQSAVFYRQISTTKRQLPTVFEMLGGGVID